MRKHLLLFLALYSASLNAGAQAPFTTMDWVNVNNISAAALVHGDMWWNPSLEVADCQFPAGSGKSMNFAGALWMSGYDAAGGLHVAAQTYRQAGNDYWPGPLDNDDTLTYATSSLWAKIWNVRQTQIDSFRALTTHTTANTPESILTWPATGNTYAAGNGGAPLTINPLDIMAPFVDLNGDGIYEPLQGEYPAIKGDQALWWVFSDNGPTHTETNGKPLGVEVHVMAYACKRGTLIDNVVYYDYIVINRSANAYSNFRIGLFDDMDLGYFDDDFIGFDSSRRLGITYNGTDCDGCSAGSPVNSYGRNMPIAGVTMVALPGDDGTNYAPVGSFNTYNNDVSVNGNPTTDTQYNYYLRAQNRVGQHITNTFQGAGIPCPTTGTGPNTNYLYTGDPSISTQWSECGCNNTPGDRRSIITTGDITLLPGSVDHVLMALVTTNLDTNNGCPEAGFDSIKAVADTAWNYYYNSYLSVANVATGNALQVYPNPAHDQIAVENTSYTMGAETIIIYNVLGQVMPVPLYKSGKTWTVDIGNLPNGLYDLLYSCAGVQTNVKLVKG